MRPHFGPALRGAVDDVDGRSMFNLNFGGLVCSMKLTGICFVLPLKIRNQLPLALPPSHWDLVLPSCLSTQFRPTSTRTLCFPSRGLSHWAQ